MSARVTGWAWDQEVLVQRKAILLWLANRATDSGVCFPGLAEIRQKTGLSESMVRRHLHWLASDRDDAGEPKAPLVGIIERPVAGSRHTSNVYVLRVPWAKPEDVRAELAELKHVPAEALEGVGGAGATQGGGWHPCQPVGSAGVPQVGGAGARPELSPGNPDRNSPLPPTGEEQQQGEGGEIGHPGAKTSPATPTSIVAAQALLAAFYRGLGTMPSTATMAMQRRDLVIACQLVDAGATPGEAETYAREMSGLEGRLAPVDLRSFERERPGWLVRRRRHERRYCDRTGLPPTWLAGVSDPSWPGDTPPEVEPVPGGPSAAARVTAGAPASSRSALAGEQLGHALRAALLPGSR